jgi:3D (Asp-Asp-Asp) domain-containing protein
MQVKVSAYALHDGLTPNSVMANGEVPYVGCAAMNGLPLGTRVRYNGQIYVIKDRVATDGVLDIFMNSVAECNEFGVRYATIEILD